MVPFKQQMLAWAGKTEKPAAASRGTVLEDFSDEVLESIDIIFESEKQDTPDSIFTKGVQDINSAILGNFALNDIVSIALETMYKDAVVRGGEGFPSGKGPEAARHENQIRVRERD